MKKYLKTSGYVFFLILALIVFIPTSLYAQKLDKLIIKRKYEKAEKYCSEQNGEYQKECYLKLANAYLITKNDYIKAEMFYDKAGKSNEVYSKIGDAYFLINDYQNALKYYFKAGTPNDGYLKLALGIFNLAQQASDKSERERLYSKTDSLFKFVNFTEFMLDVFKNPSKNLHLHYEKLSESIRGQITDSRYLYGKPVTQHFDFVLSDERINKYIYYKIMFASADVTRIALSIDLIRNGKVVSTIDGNEFSVSSKNYQSQIGFILNNNINSLPNDIIRFKITASGSNYGTYYGNLLSYIKIDQPINSLDTAVLSERKKAINWCVSNSKWSHPSGVVLDFIAQLDYCVLKGKNGKWNMGWGSLNDDLAYQVSWKNNALSTQKLTKEKANLVGIKEFTTEFSIIE
jgi:tetratricopeptide (TPR) repeat protein